MNKITLLTGATGFVGYQVLRELNKQSIQTRVVIREGRAHKLPENSELESIVTTDDLFSESVDWWVDVLDGVDTIIHLAWYAEPGKYVTSIKNMDCMIGTLNIANAAIKAEVRRFVGTGTCSEYQLTGSKLSAETLLDPCTPYAAAKAATYMALAQLLPSQGVSFLWCRLFYLYGDREDSRRLVPYLREKLSAGEVVELTSGQQYRDFLDVKEAAAMIIKSALTDKTGAVNICSGVAVTVRELAERIADEYGRRDLLNFGAREDNVFDPPYVVGIKEKWNMNIFDKEVQERVEALESNEVLKGVSERFIYESMLSKYSYNFSWLGRPIIQYPQDIIAMQEIIWQVKPDLIIETGIAHGGSLIFSASMLAMLDMNEAIEKNVTITPSVSNRKVLGVDVDIREHNHIAIKQHPMASRIQMLEGSSIAEDMLKQVKGIAKNYKRILVCLDSNHTHEHVLAELEAYAPLVSQGSYCVVFDTIIESMPEDMFPDRPWGKGDNPKTAVLEYLRIIKEEGREAVDGFSLELEVDEMIENKLLITAVPNGYLKRV